MSSHSESRFAATEVAIYNTEEGAWYRLGDEPWKIRDAVKGQPARSFARAEAVCYNEAYEKLFGHVVILPTLTKNRSNGDEQ